MCDLECELAVTLQFLRNIHMASSATDLEVLCRIPQTQLPVYVGGSCKRPVHVIC